MSVVVSYLPSPEGEAAITRAADEARDGGGPLIVVPSRGRRDELNAALERIRADGVQAEVADPDGDDITDFLLDLVRSRSARCWSSAYDGAARSVNSSSARTRNGSCWTPTVRCSRSSPEWPDRPVDGARPKSFYNGKQRLSPTWADELHDPQTSMPP